MEKKTSEAGAKAPAAVNKQKTPQAVDPSKITTVLRDGEHILEGSRVVVKDFKNWDNQKKVALNKRFPKFFPVVKWALGRGLVSWMMKGPACYVGLFLLF